MTAISVQTLKVWTDEKKPHQLIDVREVTEHNEANIGGLNIPMDQIMERLAEIEQTIPVIIYCKSGRRAQAAVEAIKLHENYKNLLFLEGGICAYAEAYQPHLIID
jgi:rhodanese-related sulfurtransferase